VGEEGEGRGEGGTTRAWVGLLLGDGTI